MGKEVWQYTDIKNTAGAKHRGCKHTIACETIDGEIWDTIHNWMTTPSEITARLEATEEAPQATFEQAELERLDKELGRARNGKARLLNLLADSDDMLIDDVKAKLLKLKGSTAASHRSELEQVIQAQANSQFSVNLLQDAMEYYLTLNPEEITFDQKRELVRMIVKEIRVYKEDGKIQIMTF
ncbi:hypothetical protein [Paenibacillus sp. FSL M8-0142]|uniref:hypothetical protein n=1 Tax=Paenibacillus sp. FSL M8-0142 TaxID=2954525 RepID=UPI00315A86C2